MIFKSTIIRRISTFKRNYAKTSHNKWKSVVGLEVHAQIASASKLFSGASTEFSSPVNNNVSFLDCSIPGTLPVLNKRCVEAGVLTALALGCTVNPVSCFDRKHYFYADLPCGYQITQQRSPLAVNGDLEFQVYNPIVHKRPYEARAKIKQLQLEQDSGKSLHDENQSLVDLNRAGVPLMELVFEPDLTDGEEAAALIKELIAILQRIQTCSCKMEEGALRVDANVSIHRDGESLGVRTEIKNIGSIRGVAGAIAHEIKRQIALKEAGQEIVNETRSWDAVTKTTVAMRDKEVQQDYRYMPEPNLPPLHVAIGPIEKGCVNADLLKSTIPELPKETRQKLMDLGLTLEQSIILVNDSYLLDIFQNAVRQRKIDAKVMVNFLLNELNRLLNKKEMEASDLKCPADHFGEIVQLMEEKKINRIISKLLLEEIILGNTKTPSEIVKERNLFQISNEQELEEICINVVAENPKLVKQYKDGKEKFFKALMGAIVKKSQERADMAKCSQILEKILSSK